MTNTKHFLRCPCCGRGGARSIFTRGALGYPLEALRQEFVPKGTGDNNGAIIWSRRPFDRAQLEHVGRAVAQAYGAIVEQLGHEVPAEPPESVLASIEDDVEAVAAGDEWLEDSRQEYERRRAIVMADRRQRGMISDEEI